MTQSMGAVVPEPVAPDRRGVRHRIVHLSDPHLAARAGSGPDAPAEVLADLLHDLRFVRDVDLVVISGDVVSDGSTTTYVAARRAVGAFAATHDAPHVYALGDRDDHTGFADILGSGHLAPDDLDVGAAGPEGDRRGWCSEVDGLRVITLDTTVPGARHGQLGEAQAQWLAKVLRTPAPHGTVLVLHHPPLSPEGHRHLAARSLRDPERLAEAIHGTDVLLVLAGHVGAQVTGMLAGVPVLVAPAVAGRADLSAPDHLDRTVRGAGALVIDLGGPFSPRSHTVWARDPRAGEQLDLRDPASGQAVAGEDLPGPPTGPPVAPAASLSERIPQGVSPAAAVEDEDKSWPVELDSSTRTVAAVPPLDPVRTDPVWLDPVAVGDGAAQVPTGPAGETAPSALSTPPVRPAQRRVPVAAPEPELEDTALMLTVPDLDRHVPEPVQGRPQGWAPEPAAPAEATYDGVEDSGVLSWAFAAPDDEVGPAQ